MTGPVLLGASGGVVALVLVAAVALGAGVAVVLTSIERRRVRSRIYDMSLRLGLERSVEGDDVDAVLAGVERLVRETREEATDAAEARVRLQRALDGLTQGVLILDETGAVLECNTVAESFVSARHADAVVEGVVGELAARALEGHAANRTVELYGPPRRVVVVDTAPLESPRHAAVVVIIDDVTERHRLEAVRRDFVANISHELKTPVGAIGLLAETLMAEDDPAVASRLADRIQSEALRVGRTIEDLLELSRIETVRAADHEPVAGADVVSEAVGRLRPAAEQRGIGLEVDAVDDVDVAGDRRQLTSALYNLLDNAVKYSDAGTPVRVAARVQADGTVVLSVTDRGIGIPARDLERVFERFYRVDQARSRQTGGTGLGLAIVRHVAVNHRGSVDVDSRLGEGSTFTLVLPALNPPAVGTASSMSSLTGEAARP